MQSLFKTSSYSNFT